MSILNPIISLENIEKYLQMQAQVKMHRERLNTLKKLIEKPFIMEKIPFSHIAAWEFWETEQLRRYITNPSNYVWIRDSELGEVGQKGIILDVLPDNCGPILWEKEVDKEYMVFPVRAKINNNYEGVEANETITELQKKHRTGIFIAQHLLNCEENGESIEYLKGYLEILDC